MADITINIRIRRDIKRQLQFYACDRDIPLRNLTDSILSEWVQKQEILVISPSHVSGGSFPQKAGAPSPKLIADLSPTDFACFPKESKHFTL